MKPVLTYQIEQANTLLGMRSFGQRAIEADRIRQEAAEEQDIGTVVSLPCYECEGRPGTHPTTRKRDCLLCDGKGWLPFEILECSGCDGHGRYIPDRRLAKIECDLCEGAGRVVDYYAEGEA